ncbi:FKBP-type peptidyl-prolyl cis-trans isomerase FkpA [Lacibacter cauensis]|uniref:Peptidyl-prolyl cis-trans isomerase n=1 Tax=Lacibacter cauensis TaxID=510947 RepID=A0A562SAI2_9BACT|nr:FKBP-type peptidyl-prolyl cis-trans isomerase [Lacibacter cauensis]TWI78288.1 FKBP-type peptidyl-prolyl cis-trans isomerase FkpA [Lacibacter cauensis]
MKRVNLKLVVAVVVAAFLISACGKKDTKACTATPGTTVASDAEKAMVIKYLDSMGITTRTELSGSGLYYVIDTAGNSKRAGMCTSVTVAYKGYYRNGNVFDQATAASPATFPEISNLIEGWRRTLPLIGEGGVIRMFIPPSLGYGISGWQNPNTGLYYILPNAVLIFEMKLIAING